jgi:hypothetical protein
MSLKSTPESAFIRDNFGEIWPVHLRQLTRLLVRLRREFDGDLDLLLVLAVIADRVRPEGWSPELRTSRNLSRGEGAAHFLNPINIQSVAEFSGIPRETVRRKVRTLEARGWVARNTRGHLAILPRAAEDLEAATLESVDYMSALVAVVDRLQGR